MAPPLTVRTLAGDEVIDLVEFERRVQAGEVSPQSLVSWSVETQGRFVPAAELKVYQAHLEPRRAYFSRAFSVNRFPFLTSALIVAAVAAFVHSAKAAPLDIDDMVRLGGKVGPLVLDVGQLWRLLMANVLHRDAVHIGVNLFVFFNVGGALENTYRLADYVFILVASAVSSMLASLWLSDAVSVGASGIVFGCLGAVMIFGFRFRPHLPTRYRRILGDAAVPTVVGFLIIGLTSAGVDNWAHLGGLFGGMASAALLTPRLLAEPRTRWATALRFVPSALVLGVLAMGEPLAAVWLPSFRVERDDRFGLSVPVPATWRQSANRFGALAFSNGLPGVGRATFAAEAIDVPVFGSEELWARRFMAEQLSIEKLGPPITSIDVPPLQKMTLGGRPAARVEATLSEGAERTRMLAVFVTRGATVFRFVWTWPLDYPRYEGVSTKMLERLKFEEPRQLRNARAVALLFPNRPDAVATLGEALRRDGKSDLGAAALRGAVRSEPGNVPWRVALAEAEFERGDVARGCEEARAVALYDPDPASGFELLAACSLARGDVAEALGKLEQAQKAAPGEPRIESALQMLKRLSQN